MLPGLVSPPRDHEGVHERRRDGPGGAKWGWGGMGARNWANGGRSDSFPNEYPSLCSPHSGSEPTRLRVGILVWWDERVAALYAHPNPVDPRMNHF